jgi:hypothetical protein
MTCLNPLRHGPHEYLADSDAVTLSPCPGADGVDPSAECPHEDGPYHFWTCDGPFTVTCDNCGADGRITVTEEGGA